MTQIEALTTHLTTGQKKLVVGGAAGALIVGILSCCTPVKPPLWIGFLVGIPVAFVTDWRCSETNTIAVSTGRDASRYTRPAEAVLAIVGAVFWMPPVVLALLALGIYARHSGNRKLFEQTWQVAIVFLIVKVFALVLLGGKL